MKVSILINNYNYAAYLPQCIDSLLNQTYKDIEIIVYDDGSKDNSLEVLKNYGESIKVIANPNFGNYPSFNQGNAINQAFKESTGDIICFLDSDDFFTPDKVEKVVNAFKKDKDILLVQDAAYIYIDGEIKGVRDYSLPNTDYLQLYYKKRWTAFFNPTSTLSFSRQYLNQVLPLGVDSRWRVWPDVRLSRVVPFYGKVCNLNIPLTYYRRHNANDSSVMNKKPVKALKNQIAHHGFINCFLKQNKIAKGPILYFTSFSFFKYVLKCLWPF